MIGVCNTKTASIKVYLEQLVTMLHSDTFFTGWLTLQCSFRVSVVLIIYRCPMKMEYYHRLLKF